MDYLWGTGALAGIGKRGTVTTWRENMTTKPHNVLLFVADGELILAPKVRIPIELKTVSYDRSVPVLVELKACSWFGETGLRMGFPKGVVELNVCGRQFRARLAGQPKNSPLHHIHASDAFAALFPPVAFPKDGDDA